MRLFRAAEAAAAPVKFGAEQAIVVVARRMQQGDSSVRTVDKERIAMLEIADDGAIAGTLAARSDTVRHAQLHRAAGTDHDRPVAQGVRADGRQHPDVEVRL